MQEPRVYPIHTAVRGRSRFHVDGLKGAATLKGLLEEKLPQMHGISRVDANPITGNLLVFHERPIAPARVAELVSNFLKDAMRGIFPKSMKQAPLATWHKLSAPEALMRLGSSRARGLTDREATKRLRQYGANRLQRIKARSSGEILVGQLKSAPVGLLVGSAIVSLATGGVADAVIILSVVIANAYIGFATEAFAEKTLSLLAHLGPTEAMAIRDGKAKRVPADRLVPGDIIVLGEGGYVPADARLLDAQELSVDESALTGESMPVVKHARAVAEAGAPLAERASMVYRGTVITGGRGLAVVVATGARTEVGRIQRLVEETERPGTPLQDRLDEMSVELVKITGAISIGVLGIGLLRGYRPFEMLKMAISLAIAAVPEGLPTVATVTLAHNALWMRRRKVLIRQLGAVEALGDVDVVCLDKTGTLTLNQMRVAEVVAGRRRFPLSDGIPEPARGSKDLKRLALVAALCNETKQKGEDRRLEGSPTEKALVELARSVGFDLERLRARYPRSSIEYRSESRSYMVTVHETPKGKCLVAMKGNPIEVLALCGFYLKDGKRLRLTKAARKQIIADNERMSDEALRVLGFAYGYTRPGKKKPKLTWAGQVGITDPIRPGIEKLMRRFHEAGIHTTMITGDQQRTAAAIGRALHLSNGSPLEVIDASKLNDSDLGALAAGAHVFSRVSPSDKLVIVRNLKRAGKVVAMAGDGVNDSPALRAADVGIAMGRGGTEVAREVAGIVLVEDNLADLITGIELGRTTYDDIKKSIHYLLSTNLSETLVVVGALVLGLGQPLGPLQLLWINLLTDVFPALALALDPPAEDVLKRPPHPHDAPIVSREEYRRIGAEALVMTGATLVSYAYGVGRYGQGPRASSLAFLTLTGAQLLHTFSSRSPASVFERRGLGQNQYLRMSIAFGFGLQAVSIFVPSVRNALGVAPLAGGDLLIAGGTIGAHYLVIESMKLFWKHPMTKTQKEHTYGQN